MKIAKKIFIDPQKWIVFEGLDATGKTTQLEMLKEGGAALFEDKNDNSRRMPFFTHQPSGGTKLGQFVYDFTEQVPISSALARQHLHLASHAEHYLVVISKEIRRRAVIQDRFWWSTVAYGYFGGGLSDHMSFNSFVDMCRKPVDLGFRQEREPDVIFVFLNPYEDDKHNTEAVVQGYNNLMAYYGNGSHVCPVPSGTKEEVQRYILDKLIDLGLATVIWGEA